jgi:hypothetical protein
MTPPDLRRLIGLDCECPVSSLVAASTREEAFRPDFPAGTLELRESDAVERSDLFDAYLLHQFIDVYVTGSFGFHARDKGRGVCYTLASHMPSGTPSRQITPRDIEILQALDRTPLTVEQLLKLSQTFSGQPFKSPRSVQDRLQKLHDAGWVNRWRYATTTGGASPHYYKLTLLGYRILYGPEAKPQTKRQFSEISIAHQQHTKSLADLIVHIAVTAHRRGIKLNNFYRENTLTLTVGEHALYPDCAFELISTSYNRKLWMRA